MRQVWAGGIILCGLGAGSGLAQMNMGQQQQTIGANQSIAAAIFQPVTTAPYQAEKLSRSVQTLSDGTVITHEYKGMIARDAEGRIREDLYIVHSGAVNGRQADLTLQSATVGDPVTHSMTIWTGEKTGIAMRMQLPALPGNGVAAILAAPPPPPPPPSPGAAGVLAASPNGLVAPAAPKGFGDGEKGVKNVTRTEALGQQALEGVTVTGTRTTTTIAVGSIGNDRPIVVVHEEWQSPELKIVVKTIDSDPRSGEQTMELQGLVRTDPDATLFQAPAGYQVKDMGEMMKGMGALGRAKTP